jgi:hypothetical protein
MIPEPVSMVWRIEFVESAAFFGAPLSNKYTNTFVSMKNLPLIHFAPRKTAPGIHMLEALHQIVELLGISDLSSELLKPLAKGRVERFSLRFGDYASLFDEVFFSAEGDIFHTI